MSVHSRQGVIEEVQVSFPVHGSSQADPLLLSTREVQTLKFNLTQKVSSQIISYLLGGKWKGWHSSMSDLLSNLCGIPGRQDLQIREQGTSL